MPRGVYSTRWGLKRCLSDTPTSLLFLQVQMLNFTVSDFFRNWHCSSWIFSIIHSGIYPSIPRHSDQILSVSAVRNLVTSGRCLTHIVTSCYLWIYTTSQWFLANPLNLTISKFHTIFGLTSTNPVCWNYFTYLYMVLYIYIYMVPFWRNLLPETSTIYLILTKVLVIQCRII